MKTIYKYTLAVSDDDLIQLPKHSTILSLQVQDGKPCIWVLIDSQEPLEDIHFVTYGTGHEIKPGLGCFVGTYQLNGGQLVFHVFKQN